MPSPRILRRACPMVVAAGTALSLAACGSGGVMTDGNVAATYGSTTVTTKDVQSAMSDLRAFNPQTEVTPPVAAVLLALGPEISRIAGRNGAVVSTSQMDQMYRSNGFPKGEDPSQPGLQLAKASTELNSLLTGSAAGQDASKRLLNTADVTLNPRYGSYTKGKGLQETRTDWIKATAAPSPPAAP